MKQAIRKLLAKVIGAGVGSVLRGDSGFKNSVAEHSVDRVLIVPGGRAFARGQSEAAGKQGETARLHGSSVTEVN